MINLKTQAEEIGIDSDTLLKMYELFIDGTGQDLAELKIAVQNGNIMQIENILHHIKGAATALDLGSISSLAASLEGKISSEYSREASEIILGIEKSLAGLKEWFRGK
ncbi:MAG: Hpt domain-containing protein [Spirochaetales bacterium]|nr:Hpt domain-containing protein [Spirochaetales bacterium]